MIRRFKAWMPARKEFAEANSPKWELPLSAKIRLSVLLEKYG